MDEMNNDWISRSAVIELIESCHVLEDAYCLIDYINELPAVYDADRVEEQKMCGCCDKWVFSVAENKIHILGAEQDTCIVQENNKISAYINELELCTAKINYCPICGRKFRCRKD